MSSNVQYRRNETKKLLDPSFNTKTNVIKINIANTFHHELAKFLLCWEAANERKAFVTEAIFKNGKRCDILILDDCEAWEVLHSESVTQFKAKLDSYPVDRVIPLTSEYVISKSLPMYLEVDK